MLKKKLCKSEEGDTHVLEFIASFTVVVLLLATFFTVYVIKMEGFDLNINTLSSDAISLTESLISSPGLLGDGRNTWENTNFASGTEVAAIRAVGFRHLTESGLSRRKIAAAESLSYQDFKIINGLNEKNLEVYFNIYDLDNRENVISYGRYPDTNSATGSVSRIIYLIDDTPRQRPGSAARMDLTIYIRR